MTATFYVGDAITVMNRLPEKSVDLILTSPPFLALRSYLPADHPDKALEGGSQSTPGEYIDWLLDVVDACARVLAPHGSLVFELGDTYSGSGGAGGDYSEEGLRARQQKFVGSGRMASGAKDSPQDSDGGYQSDQRVQYEGHRAGIRNMNNKIQPGGPAWPLAKSLSLIPESFRWAMVYGHNPFTGRQCDTWRLRNVIRWVRPNPPVGALGDKFRPATSELMVFCKAKDRFFDLDAVRTPHTEPLSSPVQVTNSHGGNKESRHDFGEVFRNSGNPAGAPPLDWWNVPLSDEEEPTKYGPKAARSRDEWVRRRTESLVANPHRGDYGDPVGEVMGGSNPAGAPPLDWWNIPLLDGDEETRYGKPEAPKTHARTAKGVESAPRSAKSANRGGNWASLPELHETRGAPPLDWWNIPPGGFSGAHYAVWPPELLIKPVKAMCPEKVCRVCGEPSRRISETTQLDTGRTTNGVKPRDRAESFAGTTYATRTVSQTTILGFSDCGHNDYRPGIVLDPFGGSGTTALVATGHGRDAILIDLDSRNYDLALDRVGPFILTRGELDE